MKLIARNDLSVVFLASIRGLSGPGSKLFRPVGSSHLGAIQTAPCGLLSFYLSYYIVGVSVKERERESAHKQSHTAGVLLMIIINRPEIVRFLI